MNEMNQDLLLNIKWKNYFNWTVVFPTLFMIGALVLIAASFVAMYSPTPVNGPLMVLLTFLGVSITMLMIFSVLIVFAYLIWFVIATDKLFQLLGMNRWVGNILNLIGIIVIPGLSMLVLPIYFWIKMKDYWFLKSQKSSWRAVVY